MKTIENNILSSIVSSENESAKEDMPTIDKPTATISTYKKPSVIVTVPPYATFLQDVADHGIVSGLRLNTVMPVTEPLEEVLGRLKKIADGKKVYIDLKGRQIRTVGFANPPYTEVMISHPISVKTPTLVYFGDGREKATLAKVDGKRLIFVDGPQRVVGPGESINILEPSLSIEGYLTETDIAYIKAAQKVGIHDYMNSFVEGPGDITAVLELDPKARIVAKIESEKGLDFVKDGYADWKDKVRLMAARGDLYVEVRRPHHILDALETIISADPDAIAASRIMESFANSSTPACNDITDLGYLLKCGYKQLMLGDQVCLKRKSVLSALNLIEEVVG